MKCRLAIVVLAGSAAAGLGADPGLSGSAARDLRRTPVVEVFERTRDSIVNISSTSRTMQYLRSPFGMGLFDDIFQLPTQTTSLGSGFVIHPGGYIVTNAHVVGRSAELTVTFSSGEDYSAEIVASDPERDLAVIKIEPKPGETLHRIHMGRSDDLMVGETAIAIGNPVGLQHTVTTGIISALHRDVEFSNQVVYRDLIQTDASINPGNSGGPLLNIYGELIGVNTAIRGDAQNIGFAIPVDQLREVLPEMLDVEKRHRVELGMKVSGADAARVTAVRDGSPAQEAGLRRGDLLVKVDDAPIKRDVDFYIALLGRHAGDKIHLAVDRNGSTKQLTVELRPVPPPDGGELAMKLYGMKIEPLGREFARRLGVRQNTGVLVTEVERYAPAYRAGVRPGDLIVQLGRLRVRDLESVGLELESVRPNEPKYIRIWRFDRMGDPDLYEGQIQAR